VRFFRLFRHDVDDAADERPGKTRRNITAVDLDALDVADWNRRDIDRRVAAAISMLISVLYTEEQLCKDIERFALKQYRGGSDLR